MCPRALCGGSLASAGVTVVCLPSAEALELTQQSAPLPTDVRAVVWDGTGTPPDGVDDAEFWVPGHMANDAGQRAAAYRAMPRLRVVQLTSAGADVFAADVPDGVVLCDAQGVHGGSTSEWVLAAVLAVVRDIPAFVRAQERGAWASHTTDELAGKRVLVVGAGDLGGRVARRLEAFDAVPTLVARRPRPGVRGVDELPELLPDADVVVLVVPLTDATRGMVDAAFLARMPDGALLVNAARGPVADTAALTAELVAGRLRAALDVTDPEPLAPESPLWQLPNVLITPHVGGNVVGLPPRAYRLVREQLARYLGGEPLVNVVREGY